MDDPRLMEGAELRNMYDHIFGANEDLINDRDIAGAAILKFIQKSGGYQGEAMNFGMTGEMIEISRKYWKLFNFVFKDHGTGSEPPDEVAMDMIGHLLLFLYHYRMSIRVPLSRQEGLMRPFGEGNPGAHLTHGMCICESRGIGQPRWTRECPVHGDSSGLD